MKLTQKQANFISMALMVLLMTMVVTLVMAFLNSAFEWQRWLKGWMLSFLVALPTVLIIMPVTRKVVFKYVE